MNQRILLPNLVSGFWLLASSSSPAIVDSNNNGVSDLWEKQHNNDELFSAAFDLQADPDGDGWTNAEEAAAGTDPFNPNPPDGIIRLDMVRTPAVMGVENGQPIVITPEVVTVSWPTIVGKQYTLLCSPDLTSESWLTADQPFIGNGNIPEFHFQIQDDEECFWRVAVCDVDTDGDTLTDAEEHELGSNPGFVDGDADGLTDLEETQLGTNPALMDTDADGLADREEKDLETDPKDQDSDNDGLVDGEDAGPMDAVINWRRSAEPSFAALLLKEETTGPNLVFMDLAHDGTTLMLGPPAVPNGSSMYTTFDANRAEHQFERNHPGLGNEVGYFGSGAISLIGNRVLGERVTEAGNQECLWDLADGYQTFAVNGYQDDFLDSHHEFFVRRVNVAGNLCLATHKGSLEGSGWGTAMVEMNGNIVNNSGYWRYDPTTDAYGAMLNLPETAASISVHAASSATFSQTWPPAAVGEAPVNHGWNLVAGVTKLLVSRDAVPFVKSGLSIDGEEQGNPVAVTRQGWFACSKQIWANGRWIPLTNLLGSPTPSEATLLGMLDTGLGIARVKHTGSSSKIMLLMPVEIVNHAKLPVSELIVADMEDSLTNAGELVLDPDFLPEFSGDPDRFYIRMPELGGDHQVSVKLSTVNCPDSTYNDAPTEIKLRPVLGGGYESESQALVSGAVDAEIATLQVITPEDPNASSSHRRTHNIQLGGKVRIADLIIDGQSHLLEIKVPVPVKNVVRLNIVVLDDAGLPNVDADLKTANEIYASTGIKIEMIGVPLRKPNLVPLAGQNPDSVINRDDVSDYGRYISYYGTTKNIKDIHAFYVLSFTQPVQGFSVTEYLPGTVSGDPLPSSADTGDANNLFVRQLRSPLVFAHEILHVLTNANHYGDPGNHNYQTNASDLKVSHNLMGIMSPNHLDTDTTNAAKRIYEEQRKMIFDHWFKP